MIFLLSHSHKRLYKKLRQNYAHTFRERSKSRSSRLVFPNTQSQKIEEDRDVEDGGPPEDGSEEECE
jgi:hypothetical protein